MRLAPARATLWDRVQRSLRLGPYNIKDPALASLFGGGPTLSGVSVNEFSALTSSPVWSGTTMIADDIASLPLFLYKRLANGGKDRFESHSLYELLHDAPNPEMDSMVFRRTMQIHLVLWQNAYAEIERDRGGRPVALWPLVPERVTPVRRANGALAYRVSNHDGPDAVIDAADMIHLVGYSHDGSVGSSLVQKARESIALGLAAEKFGASFFGNGATFGGVISYEGGKPPALTEKNTKDALNARHQGVERAYKLLALYNGAKYQATGVSPNEGQFTETRVFQIREVARWLKIPPHKLGDLADATYSNVEQMDSAYLSSCLRPYLKLWEQQLSRKLIPRLERRQQFIEHDTHGFLSVDAAGRSALYAAEFSVGSIRPNDIRGYENRDPIDGGDDAFLQIQNIPLAMIRKYWDLQFQRTEAEIEKMKQPPPAPVAPPPPKASEDERAAWKQSVEEAAAGRRLAEQRAEDLSGANTALEARNGELEAELAHTLELYAGSTTALAAEQAERAREVTELASAVDGLAVEVADREAMIAQVELQAAAARADGDAAEAARLAQEMRALAAESAFAFEQEAHGKTRATVDDLRAQVGDRDAILVARDAVIAQQAGALVKADEARQAFDQEHRSEVDRLLAEIKDFTERLPVAVADAFRSAKEAAAAAEARDAAVVQQREAEAITAAATEACDAAKRDEAIALQALAAANEVLEATRQREAKRMLDVIAAHRALVVDAMRRMVNWETDKARRHRLNPQKMRAWMETFYDGHLDQCARVLEPILRAHLAWMQSDVDPAERARALAAAYVEQSQQQLRSVLAVEEFEPTLARTLDRWEQKRPELIADDVVREGVAYVRSLQ